jgi:hypothetical protein
MPQLQVIDTTRNEREPSGVSEFFSKLGSEYKDKQENQQIGNLIGQYQQNRQDANAWEDLQLGLQKSNISPMKRLQTQQTLNEIQKTITEKDKALNAQLKVPKKTQASQPIDEDQLQKIQSIRKSPDFEKASIPKKYQMLTDAGVSKENATAETKAYAEEANLVNDRASEINKKQAQQDFNFANEQVEKIPTLFNREETLQAAEKLNQEGATGGLWDQAMQKAGLLQYTSDGFREFSSYAKESVKNQGIKNVIGSQISQMEFGFFRDATISERFSKEANERILEKEKLALRYDKLYADITKKIIEDNNGEIPTRLQSRVNDEFAKQSKKLSTELKTVAAEYEAIQNIPDGKVLMYDNKRRPLHVPANRVKFAEENGATLS